MDNILAFLQLILLFLEVQAGLHERRLFNKFRAELEGFARYERPATNEDAPLKVEMGLTLQQIIDVDEKNQIIYTNMWMTMTWMDYKLAWDPVEFGNITQVTIPYGLIWRPDILMYNSAADSFDASYPSSFRVMSDGTVEQIPPGMLKSSCSINIRWFPFDEQVCMLKFGSWTYDGSKIDLRLLNGVPEGSLQEYKENGEWRLLKFPATRNVIKYDCCPTAPFIDLTFELHIRRRKLYYLVNIVAPCVLFAMLGLFTFALPPDAGEKISFSVTVLLSLTVFMMIVSETLPPTSEAIPLIAVYFMCIMTITAGSILATVTCLGYHHRSSETHVMPRWVKVGIGEWCAWILRMQRPGYENITKNKSGVWKHKKERSDLKMLNLNASESLMANIRGGPDEAPEYFYSSFAESNPNIHHIDHGAFKIDMNASHMSTSSGANLSSASLARFELRAILRELRFLTEKQRDEDKMASSCSDWKWCAMVLDRFFIWMFFLINIVTTLVVMFSAPHLFD